MARFGPITNLPQSILRDAGKLRIFATSFETVRPPFSVQKRGSLMSGISVSEACLPEALNKIVGAGQPVAPLVGRPEILVCVNWPGYSHVITRYQVKQYLIMHYTTLAGFVGAVGEQLADYIEVCSNSVVSADAQVYEICRGPGGLTKNNVYIRGFNNTFDGVWQVDLDICL